MSSDCAEKQALPGVIDTLEFAKKNQIMQSHHDSNSFNLILDISQFRNCQNFATSSDIIFAISRTQSSVTPSIWCNNIETKRNLDLSHRQHDLRVLSNTFLETSRSSLPAFPVLVHLHNFFSIILSLTLMSSIQKET